MLHALIMISLVGAQPAAAAPAAAKPAVSDTTKVDPTALAAAERLLVALDYDRMMGRMVDEMTTQMRPMLKAEIERKVGETVDDELINRIDAIQQRYVRSLLIGNKNLRRAGAALYAKHFSIAELDRMSVLMADPTMKRWMEVTPAMMRDLMPLIVATMGANEDELKAEIVKAVTDYVAEKEDGS